MFSKRTSLRLLTLVLVFGIILLTISARGCHKRSKKLEGSSTINAFTIEAPSNLIATLISSSQINLSWMDNSANNDGFAIERKEWINGTWREIYRTGPDDTFYQDTGLNSFVIYYYRVRAYNNNGDYSEYSNEANADTSSIITQLGIYAGFSHNLVITNDGVTWEWGQNDAGQLGLGDFINRTVPVPIATDWNGEIFDGLSSAAMGQLHTIACKTDSTLWTWGVNGSGQLGFGDTFSINAPDQVRSYTDWAYLSAGWAQSLALKTDRTLWAWGWNFWGQLGLGDSRWGTERITPTQIGADSDWAVVMTGYYHTNAIKVNGTIWSCGYNNCGQLGIGDTLDRNTLTQIGSNSNWFAVACGESHTSALRTNRTIWAWGKNISGQLGLGDTNDRYSPVQAGTQSDWSRIAAGYSHTIAIKTNGTIWSWGSNSSLGLGDTNNRNTPSQVGLNSDWFGVTSGSFHVIAIKTDSTIWAWGSNSYGQLGLGDNNKRNTPTQIIFGVPHQPLFLRTVLIAPTRIDLLWTDISYNENGFKIERKIGVNGIYEQIATVDTDITSYSDITASGFSPTTYYYYRVKSYNDFSDSNYTNEACMVTVGNWSKAVGGGNHTLGIKTNSTLWACGGNLYGQLGLGDTNTRITPDQIGSNSDWSTLAAGQSHTIGLNADSTIWTWGANGYGQLGVGDTTQRNTPAQIGTDSDWSMADAGKNHTLALKTNRTIWSCGDNQYGQLGLGFAGSPRTSPVPVGSNSDWDNFSAGDDHSLACKTNRTLWAWGKNYSGQLGIAGSSTRNSPTPIGTTSDWLTVSCGSEYTIALKTNSSIWAWGVNGYGQLGFGDTTQRNTPAQIDTSLNWSNIAAGGSHTIARKTDGTIWVWGKNDDGQLGLGDAGVDTQRITPAQIGTDKDWVAITAGSDHTIASKTNSTIWTWGYNNAGQLGLGDLIDRSIPTLLGE